jgi:hypothetical protein
LVAPLGADSTIPGAFTDALNDLYIVGLFEAGPIHENPAPLASLVRGNRTSF